MVDNKVSQWIGKAEELKRADLLSAARLVFEGKSVIGNVEQISARLKRAHKLALLRDGNSDRIVGVAALKSPDEDYRRNTFDHAGATIIGYEAAPELGYIVIVEDKRGQHLPGKLVQLILGEVHGPVFSTTDNDTMKKNLHRAGFKQIGQEWIGERGTLSLWTATLFASDAT